MSSSDMIVGLRPESWLSQAPVVVLVVGQASLAQQLIAALADGHKARCQLPIAVDLTQARAFVRRCRPMAILLDEASLPLPRDSEDPDSDTPAPTPLVAAVCELASASSGGLVLVADPGCRTDLQPLSPWISSGRIDLMFALGDYVSLAAALLERRLPGGNPQRIEADQHPAAEQPDPPEDFGEVLRHEVNNPLTGILGNAELLLARRERLPESAVRRLEVIAELAVRLRETIRRLSKSFSAAAVFGGRPGAGSPTA